MELIRRSNTRRWNIAALCICLSSFVQDSVIMASKALISPKCRVETLRPVLLEYVQASSQHNPG